MVGLSKVAMIAAIAFGAAALPSLGAAAMPIDVNPGMVASSPGAETGIVQAHWHRGWHGGWHGHRGWHRHDGWRRPHWGWHRHWHHWR